MCTSTKPLCLACEAQPVHCVAMAPLCGECDPHKPEDWGGAATFGEHAEVCRPCRVFLYWLSLEAAGFPNTEENPRSARVRLMFATGSPLYDAESEAVALLQAERQR